MSKLSNELIDKEEDTDLQAEHGWHKIFHENCSECYSENAKIKQWKDYWRDKNLVAHLTGIRD